MAGDEAEGFCFAELEAYSDLGRSHGGLTIDGRARIVEIIMPYWIDAQRAAYRDERKLAAFVDIGGEG